MMSALEPCTKDRVLIVDDEQSIRTLFSQVLSFGLPDCRMDLAVNGAEAVESFREIHQAVVLMDLCMPVMDGNEAFDEIRKACEELKWEMPSVVFCTGYDPSQQVQNAIAGNPKHCLLRKPVTNDTLTEAIKIRLLDAYL
jgi:CheY-like chemotaxis protein